MPRFVILEHDQPTLHWDFMLEADGVLATWRLPAPPTEMPREAIGLGDHRIAYLDYEGPVSGGRGAVKRWDEGEYETRERSATKWSVKLKGTRWSGVVTLERQSNSPWIVSWGES